MESSLSNDNKTYHSVIYLCFILYDFYMFSWVQLTCLAYWPDIFPTEIHREMATLTLDWFIHPSIVSLCLGVIDAANFVGILHICCQATCDKLECHLEWEGEVKPRHFESSYQFTQELWKLSIFSDALNWKRPLPLENKFFIYSWKIFAALASTSHRQDYNEQQKYWDISQ